MATSNPYTSAQAPGGAMNLIAPDIAAEQLKVMRQQQIADLLRKQSLEPSGPTEMVSGWAVKKSPLEGLSKMAQALSANYTQGNVDEKNLSLAKALQGRLSDYLGSGAPASSTPGAPEAQGNNPSAFMPPQPATPGAPVAPGSPAPGPNNFNMGNLLRGSVIEQLGGAPAGSAYWDQFKAPDVKKVDQYLGITQDQSREAELAKRRKEGYIPPTRLGEGAYADSSGNPQGLPTTAPPGYINVRGPDGQWATEKVQGGTNAVTASAKAKELGSAEATPTVAYGPGGTPIFSTKAQDVARATGAPPPQPGVTGDFKGDPADVSMAIDRIKDPQERANARSAFEAQMNAGGGALPKLTPQIAPGVAANADAAQKASAQTMHASYSKLQSSNSSAQAALDALEKMQGLAAKKSALWTAGALGTHQSAINPDAAEYEKQRANLIAQLAQQNGTNGTDAGRALTAESVPDFGKPKPAIADGLGTLKNQTVAQQIKTNFLTPVYQSGDSKKYTTLENQFDQNVSPSMVPLLTMPPGPQRAEQLKAAAKDPAMRKRLTWAAENGLLK